MNLLKRKKFKYGSLAVGLTVTVVALIIILNAVFSALASHFFWYVDMTPGQIFQLSDKTTEYLDKIDDENNKVVIYFFTEKDNLNLSVSSSNYITETTLWGMKPIHELVLQLADRYDYISVEYIDPISNPDTIKEIVGNDTYSTTSFTERHILIVNYTYERNADGSLVYGSDDKPVPYVDYKICSRNSFYLFDHTTGYVNAFRGDYYLTSTVMALTKLDKPTVYFLTGHSELVGAPDETAASSYGDAVALYYLFEELGCDIKKIDLKYDDFDAKDENSIVVIYGPQRDITSSSNTLDINETDKIKSFLDKKGNSMMVFLSSKSVELPELEALIKDYSDVTVSNTVANDSGEASVSTDGYSIVGEYSDSDVTKRLNAAGDTGKAVFRNALPLVLPKDSKKTSAVVLLPESAAADNTDTRSALMTVSDTKNGGKFVVCASTEFASNEMLESYVYSNKGLLTSQFADMNMGEMPLGINNKVLRSEGLDRTEQQARYWTIAIVGVIPAIFAIAGTIVYVRRRHS